MPDHPRDEFFEKLVVAFERCLIESIHTLIPATPPLRTFRPRVSSTVTYNSSNDCWCPQTLNRDDRHSKYHCPKRPVWKLGENFRFRPCRHTPNRTPVCDDCVNIPRLARDFVTYVDRHEFIMIPEDPDLDVAEVEGKILRFYGVTDPSSCSYAELSSCVNHTLLLVHLVDFSRRARNCRFASHLEPAPDMCLVHGILRWDEWDFMACVDVVFRHLRNLSQHRRY